jgi:hypothetical protein
MKTAPAILLTLLVIVAASVYAPDVSETAKINYLITSVVSL